MSTIKKVTVPAYNIEGLTGMEVEVICAALAASTSTKVKHQLRGEGFEVELARVTEMIDQLWEDIHEQRV